MRKQAVCALLLSMCMAVPAMAGEMETEPDMIIEESESGYEPESETWETAGAEEGILIDLSDASDDIVVPQAAAAAEDSVALSSDNFPDQVFRGYLKKFDLDGSDSLDTDEIAAVKEIDVEAKKVGDLTGLSYFTELETLMCDNNSLTELDVSRNTKLKTLTCSYNDLTSLDVYKNRKLLALVCSHNSIPSIDVTNAPNLQDLRIANNELEILNVGNNPKLAWLDCSGNHLTALDASGHISLQYLHCYDNELASLDVTGDTSLQWLECQGNRLSALDVFDTLNVKTSSDSAFNLLNCADNQLTSIDITNKAYFKGLVCSNNQLASLDLTGTPDLRQLECENNQLTALDVTDNTKLQTLDCSGNKLLSLDLRNQFIDTTSVLPDCSGQSFRLNLEETDTGYQADLSKVLGTVTGIRKGTAGDSGFGSLTVLNEEGELDGNLLSFTGEAPEVLRIAAGTGYSKKPGDKDVFLGIEIHCHMHSYQQTDIREANCTEDGEQTLQCTECGFEKKVVLPATGHRYEKDSENRAATCTEDGLDREVCANCGDIKENLLPATGHSYNITRQDATCTKDGYEKQKCTRCGDEIVTEFPAFGHDYQVVKETAPTCEENGYIIEECTHCGDRKEKILTATGHFYEPSGRTEPTCEADGILEGKCALCGDITTTPIPVTGHSFVKKETAASYTAAGRRWEECTACGKTRNSEVIPMLVKPAEPDKPLAANKLSVAPGKSISLKKYAPAGGKVTYKSSNSKVATVSKKGVVKAKKSGTVRITIMAGKTKKILTIRVTAPAKITNVPAMKTLKKGKSFQLKPKASGKVTYKSSNKKVATVSSKGRIKAKKKGTAKITVTAGGQKKVCKVTVK